VALVALALFLVGEGILPGVLPIGSSLSPLEADIARNVPVMLWGYLARRLGDERPPRWLKFAVWALPLWYGARLCLALVENLGHGQPAFGVAARAAGAYLIGVSLFALGTFVVPLRSRALSWVGRTSYSSYLFHPPIIYGLRALTRALPFLLTLPALIYLGLVLASPSSSPASPRPGSSARVTALAASSRGDCSTRARSRSRRQAACQGRSCEREELAGPMLALDAEAEDEGPEGDLLVDRGSLARRAEDGGMISLRRTRTGGRPPGRSRAWIPS
jgi:hypothetical protein